MPTDLGLQDTLRTVFYVVMTLAALVFIYAVLSASLVI